MVVSLVDAQDHLERALKGRPADAVAALASFREHRSTAGSTQSRPSEMTVSIPDDSVRDTLQPSPLRHACRASDAASDSDEASHLQPMPIAAQTAGDMSAAACCSGSSSSLGRRPLHCSATQSPDRREGDAAACLAEGQMLQLTDGGGADVVACHSRTGAEGSGPALQGAAPTVADNMGGAQAMGRLERQLTKVSEGSVD